jgi:hypothetical protein
MDILHVMYTTEKFHILTKKGQTLNDTLIIIIIIMIGNVYIMQPHSAFA